MTFQKIITVDWWNVRTRNFRIHSELMYFSAFFHSSTFPSRLPLSSLLQVSKLNKTQYSLYMDSCPINFKISSRSSSSSSQTRSFLQRGWGCGFFKFISKDSSSQASPFGSNGSGENYNIHCVWCGFSKRISACSKKEYRELPVKYTVKGQ